MALVGSVVGEFISGNTGAGYLVMSGQMTLDTPLVFAALLSITALAVVGIGAVGLFERIFLSWRPSMRAR
jgi:NitT/TauT family transport system permease protein